MPVCTIRGHDTLQNQIGTTSRREADPVARLIASISIACVAGVRVRSLWQVEIRCARDVVRRGKARLPRGRYSTRSPSRVTSP